MKKLKNSELGRKSVEEFKTTNKSPVILVLDNIRSANNVGSVFRSADAFLVEDIFLCGITAVPPNKEILKTALGSTGSVTWHYFNETKEAIQSLKDKGYSVYCIEQVDKSIRLDRFKPMTTKHAFVFGNEIRGVSQHIIDMCDGAIEIPQFGTKHSFNIAVSAGIVLWDFYTK
jgi:tRNA G18 (ribose-2'-O)-methylase SpoU